MFVSLLFKIPSVIMGHTMQRRNFQMCEKFNSFPNGFPISATLFQKLEKQGGILQAGDVLLRQSLECIVPLQGARSTWFGSVARQVNIPPRRIKSLFYNRQCRVWGEELARINGALSKAVKSQNIEMLDALNANAETRAPGRTRQNKKGDQG